MNLHGFLSVAVVAALGCSSPPEPRVAPEGGRVSVPSDSAPVASASSVRRDDSPGRGAQELDVAKQLRALFAEEWERGLREDPVSSSLRGDRRFNRSWADSSLAGLQRSHEGDRAALAKLEAIDFDRLRSEDQIHARIFRRMLEDNIRSHELGLHLMPLTQRGGVQTLNQLQQNLRFETVQDYDDWLARLSEIDAVVEQTIELMTEGIARGLVQPKVLMKRVPKQIAFHVVENPKKSPFYKIFAAIPEDFEARDRLQSEAMEVISTVVVPAYRRFDVFFNTTYLPACRETIAAAELPDGEEIYAHQVAYFTTTEMTPDEVHQVGLAEVERIRSEMKSVMRETKFKGNFKRFLRFLRTNPRFFYRSSDQLLEGYNELAARLDDKLPLLFGRLPKAPYEVRAIPDEIAPDTTTAYYSAPAADGSRPGYYWVNLYDVKSRPKWEMAALSVHEAVPGHHLQISIAMELEDLPEFRKNHWVTAFGEGWALYSERLGYDMGLYDDPYDRFGQLTYDMWRAVRLVVDTGMHAKGWSRRQAIDYFLENAPKSRRDITNEIDRYIGWPGQALAYKIGQLEILRLRAKAEEALGDAFDIRAFHDVVLGSGGVPLDVLATNVESWIESQESSSLSAVKR